MPENNKKLVLFDFDGVFIDTLLACYTTANEANENLTLEEYKGFFCGNIHDSVRANGEPRKPNPNFADRYRTHTRELKVPLTIKETVKNLSTKYTLDIISSTPTASITEILAREGIQEYFATILGSDVHGSKVIKIKMALEKYGAKPEDTVFITDTLGDIKEAAECNVPAIAVTWGFHERATLEKGNPMAIIEDPSMLLSKIDEVLG